MTTLISCELSGQPLASTDDAVVTPSGHVCSKRLLLQKLTENNNSDPFESDHQHRPLTEDDLIPLQLLPKIVPPRIQASSLPALLHSMQDEYDALVLELFDTRKALEETRQELSQALYQNDAALRVVARLALERDAARQQVATWQKASAASGLAEEEIEEVPPLSEAPPIVDKAAEPLTKKRKVDEVEGVDVVKQDATDNDGSDGPLLNDLPEKDLQVMMATWEQLHESRKIKKKDAASKAPLPITLGQLMPQSKSLHKTSCKGLTAVAASATHDGLLVTAGKDKQVVIYDLHADVIRTTISVAKAATAVDIHNHQLVAVGMPSGLVAVYALDDRNDAKRMGDFSSNNESPIVKVSLHPDGQHVLAASQNGQLMVARIHYDDGVTLIASFIADDGVEYTCGCLHPDGLIYLAGTVSGELFVWDLKSKCLASKLKENGNSSTTNAAAITSIAVSSNGYHIATADESGAVKIWDLRKSKVIRTLNTEAGGDDDKHKLDSVEAVTFDTSGKYLAYAGQGGVLVVVVKGWNVVGKLDDVKVVSGLVWGGGSIAAVSNKKRDATLYSLASE